MLVNEKVSFGHKGPRGWVEDNASSAEQSRGPKRWSAVQGNVPGNFVGTDKHYRNIGQGGVLKYLRRKLLPPPLNALQLILWSH